MKAEVIYEWNDGIDHEKNLFLRSIREKLGYGLGWTFWDALWEWVKPKLVLVILFAVWLYLSMHLQISIDWR
jgi:hypothetical protein